MSINIQYNNLFWSEAFISNMVEYIDAAINEFIDLA